MAIADRGPVRASVRGAWLVTTVASLVRPPTTAHPVAGGRRRLEPVPAMSDPDTA